MGERVAGEVGRVRRLQGREQVLGEVGGDFAWESARDELTQQGVQVVGDPVAVAGQLATTPSPDLEHAGVIGDGHRG